VDYIASSDVIEPINHKFRGAVFEKLTVPYPAKKLYAFYGTGRFITVFTRACHLPPSWAR